MNDFQTGSLFQSQIRVARSISCLFSRPRESILSDFNIRSIDKHLLHCLVQFPLHHYLSTTDYIDPFSIGPIIYLQNTRLALHRLNLTPLAPPASRFRAIEGCVEVAQRTSYVMRAVYNQETHFAHPTSSRSWEERMSQFMITFLCTHLCRCILFLSFSGDFAAALVCARASVTLGSARPVNVSCGRYLAFFLSRLEDKLSSSSGSHQELNEELVAYLSADLQRGDDGWVFETSAAQGSATNNLQSPAGKSSLSSMGNSETSGDAWPGIIEQLEKLNVSRLKLQYCASGTNLFES